MKERQQCTRDPRSGEQSAGQGQLLKNKERLALDNYDGRGATIVSDTIWCTKYEEYRETCENVKARRLTLVYLAEDYNARECGLRVVGNRGMEKEDTYRAIRLTAMLQEDGDEMEAYACHRHVWSARL